VLCGRGGGDGDGDGDSDGGGDESLTGASFWGSTFLKADSTLSPLHAKSSKLAAIFTGDIDGDGNGVLGLLVAPIVEGVSGGLEGAGELLKSSLLLSPPTSSVVGRYCVGVWNK
jgi:hypothetical protein